MWINTKMMPLQSLADKVSRSKAWSKLRWQVEEGKTFDESKILYDIQVGTNQTLQKREVAFKEICDMFGWKSFSIHPSKQMVLIKHYGEETLKKMLDC